MFALPAAEVHVRQAISSHRFAEPEGSSCTSCSLQPGATPAGHETGSKLNFLTSLHKLLSPTAIAAPFPYYLGEASMQQPYKGLARIYDYLLSGVNYQEWADYLEQLFGYFKIEPCRKVLDLAGGTGNSTLP